jgi:hypothetical protein
MNRTERLQSVLAALAAIETFPAVFTTAAVAGIRQRLRAAGFTVTPFDYDTVRIDRAAPRPPRTPRHGGGTRPDTALHLGDQRRTWLKARGGLQPGIVALIDAAMQAEEATTA